MKKEVEIDHVSDMLAISIIRAMIAEKPYARTSETSANFYQTIWRNIQEDTFDQIG
jgi:hypothetical protein